MFPEPPDPNKMWARGLFILAVLLLVYFFMKEGLRMVVGSSQIDDLHKPYQMELDGKTD